MTKLTNDNNNNNYLLKFFYAPGTVLSDLHGSPPLILKITPRGSTVLTHIFLHIKKLRHREVE